MSRPTRCDYFRGITDLNALTRACELFARDIHDRLLVGRLEGDNLSDTLLKADGGLAWSRLPNEPKRLHAPLLSTKKAPAVREKDGAGIEIVVNADDATSGRVCVVDKDNLATQIISLIPDDPEDGTSGGAVDFPAGIGVLRTSGNFNLRLSRNSVLMLELTSTHIEAADDVLPSADSTLDIGSDTTRWRYVYGDRAYVGDGAAGNQIFLDVRNASGRVQLQVNATTDRTITFQDLGYTVENTGHAAKHQNGGADEVATATAAANAIPKAGAGGTLDDAWISSVGCSLRKSTGENLDNATETVISFNTEDYDVGGCHDTGANTDRITVPAGKGGKWLITGQVVFDDNATGDRYAAVRLNGAAGTYLAYAAAPATVGVNINCGIQVSCVVDLAAADYVSLYGYQSSGGVLIAMGGTAGCRLQGWKLSS